MRRGWRSARFVRLTRLTLIAYVFGFALAFTTPLAHAVIAPTPYDSDAIEDAPEALAIKVLSVGLKEKRRNVQDGAKSILYTLIAKAQVSKVERSATGLVPGALIEIQYDYWHHDDPPIGPVEMRPIKKGEVLYAHLRKHGASYQPAADADSFSTRPLPAPMDTWEFGSTHVRADRPRPVGKSASEAWRNDFVWAGAGGLVKVDIPAAWRRTTQNTVPGLLLVARDATTSVVVNVFHYPKALTPAAGMRATQAALQEAGMTVEIKTQKQNGDDMVYQGETSGADGFRAEWIGTFRQTRKGAVGVFVGAQAGRFEANRQLIRDAYRNAWIGDGPGR